MPFHPLSTQTGCLVVIEGPDGTGKTTQLALLQERLCRANHIVASYDFPSKSGTPVGELIGSFLRGEYGEVTPEFLALAFSADRMSRRDELLGDLAAGRTVLCDRYVTSNIAFQSSKIADPERRTRLERMLVWFEYEVMKLPQPDLQIVLVAPEDYFTEERHLRRTPDKSRHYVSTADIHEARLDIQLSVNNYYRGLEASPSLCRIEIERQGRRLSTEELGNRIWELVAAAEPNVTPFGLPNA
jgi:dTMP kinase